MRIADHYLGEHPAVFMTRRKEPRFFAFENELVRFSGPSIQGKPRPVAKAIENEKYRNSVSNLADYCVLFRHGRNAVARGESSTVYLYIPKAIERINHYIPHAKLIAILRHPADRAYSKFAQMIRDGAEPLVSFREALAAEPKRIACGWAPAWHYKQRGFYHAQLSRIYTQCDPRRISVYTFEEFTSDTLRVVREIYKFIGVDDSFLPDVSKKYNVTGPINEGAEMPGMAPDMRAALVADYRDDILKLQGLIEKDLSHWLT
jgi:hypothetical protein